MERPKLPQDLLSVLALLERPEQLQALLADLLSPSETKSVGERWELVKLLAAGHSQRAVRDQVGVSITTVSRGASQYRYGAGGFDIAFDALAASGGADPRAVQEKS